MLVFYVCSMCGMPFLHSEESTRLQRVLGAGLRSCRGTPGGAALGSEQPEGCLPWSWLGDPESEDVFNHLEKTRERNFYLIFP